MTTAVACLVWAAAVAPAEPIRTVVLSEGGPVSADVKAILTDTGRFQVRLIESLDGVTPALLARFDLAVLTTGVPPGSEVGKAVAAFVASGKGLVVNAADGRPDRFVDVTPNPDHPITRGLSAVRIPAAVMSRLTNGEPVATADGKVPVVAARSHGKGREVEIAFGNDPAARHEPAFRALLARSAEWAATGAVTLPATEAPRRPANPIRALLVTGGHDHDAAFYSLFHGIPELAEVPVDTVANAFKKDLRDRYDVVVLYDFTRELDDAARKNLRAFVEAGKGVVVLHHALLNFQTWSWWSEDVVGGRYRLQREGGKPSSGVKNDQSFFVTPVGTHPVLAGVGPFRVTDEAYKNLYQSGLVKPLLATDNLASDATVAWVGPCETARVVAIQLGHGNAIFSHPSYRTLVHNAIVWTAGRSK